MSEQKPKPSKKRIATKENPHILSVLSGLLRLPSEEKALEKIAFLRESFVISRAAGDNQSPDALCIWIKGYAVTKAEAELGYTGNFAIIRIHSRKKIFSLVATKEPRPISTHPQKKYLKSASHPNWGHPLLRLVKKKKIFDRLEDAEALLLKIHEEYPDISIPNPKKLYIMVFSRAEDAKNPLQKYVLTVEVAPEGGFYIEHKINTGRRKTTKAALPATETSPEQKQLDQQGYFTSMVQLKKKTRRNAGRPVTGARPEQAPEENS